IRNHAAFIWSVADLLRGDYKQSEYDKVILPLTVIRRLDCVLAPTKEKVLQRHHQLSDKIDNLEPVLQAEAKQQFYNVSPLDFRRLLDDPNHLADNLRSYILGFSSAARDVCEAPGLSPGARRRSHAASAPCRPATCRVGLETASARLSTGSPSRWRRSSLGRSGAIPSADHCQADVSHGARGGYGARRRFWHFKCRDKGRRLSTGQPG